VALKRISRTVETLPNREITEDKNIRETKMKKFISSRRDFLRTTGKETYYRW
jgi:hypothetical protein